MVWFQQQFKQNQHLYNKINKTRLTKRYAQCVQTRPTRIINAHPKAKPECLKATPIAKMPDPSAAFDKCVKVSQSLEKTN